MTDETKRELRHDMYRAMVEVLGRGYVPDYYESAASEFIQIAGAYVERAEKSCVKAK